jgi:phosphoribosylformylglycinamidine (FGAM) synthase-like amidotransferase family enzyme
MPHPERAAEAVLGGDDGRLFLQAAIDAWERTVAGVG